MAKNRMTFEKQLRETKKKQKAAAKRENRRRQKEEPERFVSNDYPTDEEDSDKGESDSLESDDRDLKGDAAPPTPS